MTTPVISSLPGGTVDEVLIGPGVVDDVCEQLRRSVSLGENTSLGIDVFGHEGYDRMREAYASAKKQLPHVLLRPYLEQIAG